MRLLEVTPWLDSIILWEHKGRGRIARTWRIVQQLRKEQLDLLITLRASLSAGLLIRLSGAKKTVGYSRRGLRWLLTDAVPRSHVRTEYWQDASAILPPISAVDDYLHLIGTLGFTAVSRELELATTPANEAAADGVWKR